MIKSESREYGPPLSPGERGVRAPTIGDLVIVRGDPPVEYRIIAVGTDAPADRGHYLVEVEPVAYPGVGRMVVAYGSAVGQWLYAPASGGADS